MSFEVTMPALSPTMETGSLAKWLVREGEAVRAGDVLAEIETDKASMEFEAAHDGVLSRIMVAAGTSDVPVGTVIALIGDAAESAPVSTAPPTMPAAVPHTAPCAVLDTAPLPAPAPPNSAPPAASLPAPRPPTPIVTPSTSRASPLARRIAGAKGIDLGQVQGSGRDGKILRVDVMPNRRETAAAPAATALAGRVYAPPAAIPHETVKLSAMRRTIAERLTDAKQTVPHFYLSVDVRLDALLALRRDLNAAAQDGALKISVNDFLVKALAIALEETPDANVQFGGDQLYRFKRADISVAVAIPGGLITPVVRDAANKRLSRLAAETRDLAARARAGQLAPEEYQGGSASLSNLGMFGMTAITPILNPPQALILGIGAGEEKPWVRDGALAIATIMTVSGSFDHRAIDGAIGAELMRTFKRLIERPLDILT